MVCKLEPRFSNVATANVQNKGGSNEASQGTTESNRGFHSRRRERHAVATRFD